MALKDDLQTAVAAIFADKWSKRDGTVVPGENSLTLGNDGIDIEATVLYADISDSTKLVDTHKHFFSAEVYKAFLRCAARIIRDNGGSITAYDGDRVMAVYVGDMKNSSAARTALKINWCCKSLIQPALKKQYPDEGYVLHHTVGIDTSTMRVAAAGIRGANDLVWIGRAPNWAAKLCTLPHDYSTWITKAVYDKLEDKSKLATDGRNMWEARSWTAMDNNTIYRSNFWWPL
ncbi:adenylate/guanylate cyclase domain-containing protein [Mesorhizobium sp. LSHC412B00]|uniref:adenylate/guanylate cyclase domain-containing protein n=1 Tax=Mesorhizobium sp. LSHC412B00 TaxID=1287285 RepID=UPI0003CE6CDF|nr:adenylate/guanylate cyclase domain-containing protein [Mesorhizobium sp. LSHC412B00]ESX91206.1 guanylate cyclase [Mesorhizobium sp. LSHC412B00]